MRVMLDHCTSGFMVPRESGAACAAGFLAACARCLTLMRQDDYPVGRTAAPVQHSAGSTNP